MERYIDVHCHILPGVDDGAADIRETREMLNIAYKEGIRCIIATPHFHPDRGKTEPKVLRERLKLVREEAARIDERFLVFLGTEIYFGQDIPELLKRKKVLSMNRRQFVLVEFSPSDSFTYIKQGIQQLQMCGYQVILAHIERYTSITEDVGLAEELFQMGALIQVNAGSIIGDSGRTAKKFVKELLKEELVFCVGTDAHSSGKRAPRMKKAAGYVRKKYGEEYARRIFYSNALQMLRRREKDGSE